MSNSGFKNTVQCQLWMGGIEPYMSEGFIMSAFQRMGENPLSVKVMRNRITGELCGYCFVHFENDADAIKAIHKLNGKHIPNSSPPARFRLNNATTHNPVGMAEREFSLWVGDLSPDINDYQLYRTFASRYQSIRTAKVVLDSNGYCKGYGFIRFANEEEQKHCLINMNGFKGLGTKPIKMSSAIPKAHRQFSSSSVLAGGYSSSQDYSQQIEATSYWQGYTTWQTPKQEIGPNSWLNNVQPPNELGQPKDELELIDHSTHVDVDAWNRDLMERDFNMWDALESSKWLPLETY